MKDRSDDTMHHQQMLYNEATPHALCGNQFWILVIDYLNICLNINCTLLITRKENSIHWPCAPNMVALTVERIFSWVPIVGIRSHTWSRFCGNIKTFISGRRYLHLMTLTKKSLFCHLLYIIVTKMYLFKKALYLLYLHSQTRYFLLLK